MSQENVEVVLALFEAWNAGDIDGLRELWHPDAIVRPAEGWPEPGPFVGREAVMRSFEQLREAWDADTLDPIGDLIDVADRVVVRMAWQGTGHGPDLNMAVTQVFTVRTGKILGMESFWDHAEALEAVGLSESAASQESLEATLRQAFEGVNNKDLAAIQAACDPELELVSRFAAVEGRIYRGPAEMSDYLADMEAAWEDFSLTIEECVPAGREKLVVVTRVKAVARGSGVPIDQRIFGAYEFRHGKCFRGRFYSTREEALEAVGLSE